MKKAHILINEKDFPISPDGTKSNLYCGLIFHNVKFITQSQTPELYPKSVVCSKCLKKYKDIKP